MAFVNDLELGRYQEGVDTIVGKIMTIPQIEQQTKAWYVIKQKIISATDTTTIFNCNPFKTPAQLYQEKCAEVDEVDKTDDDEATRWGTHYEPIAKKLLKKRHPNILTLIDLGLGLHPTMTHIGASPDGLLISLDDKKQLHLWLVEVKCPFRRCLTQTVPYRYWLQIQTQLYVWTNLIRTLGLTLDGCLYSDNHFGLDNQHTYYDQYITYDEHLFTTQILPELDSFKHLIDTHHPPKKKCRIINEALNNFKIYLKQSHINTQKQYRNFVNNDLLLDWLNLYGDKNNKDKFSNNSFKNSWHLKENINQYLHMFQETTNGFITLQCPDYIDIPNHNSKGTSYGQLKRTYDALSHRVPLICNGVLYNPINNMLGHYDIMIQSQYLSIVFPQAYKKIKDANLSYSPNKYTFIQVKDCHLKLCNQNLYVLNASNGHKEAKMQQIHLHKVLQDQQIVTFTDYSFILGAHASYTSKSTTYENFNSLNSIGLVNPTTRDERYEQKITQCLDFIHQLHTVGDQWSIDPPCRRELYPNMKNVMDAPWKTFKHQLATKNKDLTIMWNIGPCERTKLWDESHEIITRWDQLNNNSLKLNQHYQQIIQNMVNSNTKHQPVNLNKIQLEQKPVEFYLDFEFINHYNDMSQFPICQPINYIYMIGCLHFNHITNQIVYRNYLINRLNKDQEKQMINQWLQEMVQDNNNDPEITIYHWGNAEKNQIESYLQLPLEEAHLQLVDLCEVFKTYEVTLPNCWSYNLKDISKALYALQIVKTTWTSKVTGDNTISTIIKAESACQKGKYNRLCDIPEIQEIIQYNYVDCKVLEEIVSHTHQN
jgi:putative phage-type endonuclease